MLCYKLQSYQVATPHWHFSNKLRGGPPILLPTYPTFAWTIFLHVTNACCMVSSCPLPCNCLALLELFTSFFYARKSCTMSPCPLLCRPSSKGKENTGYTSRSYLWASHAHLHGTGAICRTQNVFFFDITSLSFPQLYVFLSQSHALFEDLLGHNSEVSKFQPLGVLSPTNLKSGTFSSNTYLLTITHVFSSILSFCVLYSCFASSTIWFLGPTFKLGLIRR